MIFGKKIKELREEHGMVQTDYLVGRQGTGYR